MNARIILDESEKAFHSLANKDLRAVASEWLEILESRVKEDPIGMLLAGASVGAGLTMLRGEQVQQGVIRFAKLMAMKAIAGFEAEGASRAGALDRSKSPESKSPESAATESSGRKPVIVPRDAAEGAQKTESTRSRAHESA